MNRVGWRGAWVLVALAAGVAAGRVACGDEKPPVKPKPGAEKPGAGKPEKPGKEKPVKESPKFTLPQRDPQPLVGAIDRAWSQGLAKAGIPESPAADDAEFLRRATLDIAGRIPTYQEALAFLESDSPSKRRELVDQLLTSGDFGNHFGQRWRNLISPRDTSSAKQGPDRCTPWLAEQFNTNRPWNEIVSELLTTSGDLNRDPAATFYRANSQEMGPKPNLLAASAGKLFLGVQITCAECHNHPFSKWKQEDFWSLAAFFSRVHTRAKGNASLTEELAADAPVAAREGAIVIPEGSGKLAGTKVAARFLNGTSPSAAEDTPLRPALATWMTSKDNPYFARAMANRLWAHFFNRGIVQPIDDLREENAPSNPELLAALADEFSASGFDIKHLIRGICTSQPYSRTSRPIPENQKDEALFSHVAVKVMTAEVLYDSLHVVVNARPFELPPTGGGKKPQSSPAVSLEPRESFVRFFARSAEVDKGEQYSYGIPHMLRLMNGRELNVSPGFLARIPEEKSADEMVETIYLAVLSRRPSAAETRRMTELIGERKGTDEAVQAYGDVLWVLLNSSEFVLNR